MAEHERVALVTGAAGNVGRALAAVLARAGWRVAALDRSADPLRAVLAELPGPGEHMALPGVDLLDAAACEAAVAEVVSVAGRLDAAAHTVGAFAAAPLAGSGPGEWEAMFRVNLLTTANLYRAAAGAMGGRAGRGGALVAIGAGAGAKAPGGMAAYAASKAGVLRLTEALAEELKEAGVRVNAVLPGTVDTPQNRTAMPGADASRWVRPEQVAEVMAFLLSDAASGVTGALVPVTGRG